jgi:hypothetical protein
MPANGTPVAWTDAGGDKSQVSITGQPYELVQTYKGGGGVRVNTFRQEPGRDLLYLDVETSSSHLPQPVKYTLVYRFAHP